MATVDYKSALYEIRPSTTEQFTFWWGPDIHEGGEYFDVSIAPSFNPDAPSQLPLVEVQRAYLHDTSEGAARTVLLLTLRNDNESLVYFFANHVRIY